MRDNAVRKSELWARILWAAVKNSAKPRLPTNQQDIHPPPGFALMDDTRNQGDKK